MKWTRSRSGSRSRTGRTSHTTAIATRSREHVTAILRLHKQTTADTIEIGRRMARLHTLVVHGKWAEFVKKEFGWTPRTALNYMKTYKMVSKHLKSETVSDLNIDHRAQTPDAFFISMPADFKVELTWRDKDTLVIDPGDARHNSVLKARKRQ